MEKRSEKKEMEVRRLRGWVVFVALLPLVVLLKYWADCSRPNDESLDSDIKVLSGCRVDQNNREDFSKNGDWISLSCNHPEGGGWFLRLQANPELRKELESRTEDSVAEGVELRVDLDAQKILGLVN